MGRTLYDLLGTVNNFNEPTPALNQQKTILAVSITSITLSWICVVARIWTRLRVVYSPGWDDLFVVLALVSISVSSPDRYGSPEH